MMNTDLIALSDVIAIGGLLIAAITLIISYLRNSRADAANTQIVVDRLDAINKSVADLTAKVDKLDQCMNDHSNRITRIEAEMDGLEHRVTNVEGRMERHFGIKQPIE